MQSELFKMMNDEIEDLRAFKALALELANRKGFDSVNGALNSINHKAYWISADHDLPVNDLDEHDGNVIGLISSCGGLKNARIELVHFDGDTWYDKESKSCTVTHWIPASVDYLL
jgi:uncharacterized secreted protein with C-terminal beta-propeller domain